MALTKFKTGVQIHSKLIKDGEMCVCGTGVNVLLWL